MRRLLWFVLLLGTLLVVPSSDVAHACSCAGPPAGGDRVAYAEQRVDQSDGAFVGTLTAVDEPRGDGNGTYNSMEEVAYHYVVERAVKGDVGSTVDVWASRSDASCGLPNGVGQRYGLYLHRDGDRWQSSLCATEDPDVLLQVHMRPSPPTTVTTRANATPMTTVAPTTTTTTMPPAPPSTEPLPTTSTTFASLATVRVDNGRPIPLGAAGALAGIGVLGVGTGWWQFRRGARAIR